MEYFCIFEKKRDASIRGRSDAWNITKSKEKWSKDFGDFF